jgi:TolB protein
VARSGSDRYVVGRATQLTFEPGLEIEPAPSADGGLVAYAGGPAMRLRIYARPPGGRAVRVTPDSGRSQQRPLWSPDGTRLLFTWGPPDGALALVPALGGEPRILVRDSVYAAAWAPEGRRVAYVRGDSLYVRSLERGTARAIVGLPEMSGLAWSPDGQHIAFAAGNAAFVMHWELGNKGPSEIAVVSADGGPLVHVTDGATLNASPVWAPDSRRLLFISDRDGPRDVYVVRVDAAGRPTGNLVRLTVGLSPHSIALSADGRRLTYSVFVQRVNIWSLPIAPTTVSQSAAVPVTTGTQVIEGLSISHDGRRLYFDSNREGNANLYRLDLPGGEPVQLTTDPADEFAPSESPDGRWVAFHSLRYGTRDIMVMPAEGGEPQRVTADSTDEMLPSWSPDGRTLVYDVFGVNEHNVLYQTSRDPDGRWGRPRPFRPSGVWSPDGRTAALCAGSVQIAAVAGGAPRLLYAPRPGSNDPGADQCVWIPDGRSLVMMSHDPDDVTSYWMLPAEGGRPRLLARLDDPARPALRSPLATDGKRIYFTLYDRQSDIYVTEVSGLNRR